MIKDRLVFGTKSQKAREKLAYEDKLTFEKAIQICQSLQYSAEQLKHMGQPENPSEAVYYVSKGDNRRNRSSAGSRDDSPR